MGLPMGKRSCRHEGELRTECLYGLGVSSCIGVDGTVSGQAFMVDVVVLYPFYFDCQS